MTVKLTKDDLYNVVLTCNTLSSYPLRLTDDKYNFQIQIQQLSLDVLKKLSDLNLEFELSDQTSYSLNETVNKAVKSQFIREMYDLTGANKVDEADSRITFYFKTFPHLTKEISTIAAEVFFGKGLFDLVCGVANRETLSEVIRKYGLAHIERHGIDKVLKFLGEHSHKDWYAPIFASYLLSGQYDTAFELSKRFSLEDLSFDKFLIEQLEVDDLFEALLVYGNFLSGNDFVEEAFKLFLFLPKCVDKKIGVSLHCMLENVEKFANKPYGHTCFKAALKAVTESEELTLDRAVQLIEHVRFHLRYEHNFPKTVMDHTRRMGRIDIGFQLQLRYFPRQYYVAATSTRSLRLPSGETRTVSVIKY